jgi:hypothetical protein
MFLSIGFEKPTPEAMGEWKTWFESVGDRIVEQGGFWKGGREVTADGTKELPFGSDSITGYLVFNADSLDEATTLVEACPVILSNRVYEIMEK